MYSDLSESPIFDVDIIKDLIGMLNLVMALQCHARAAALGDAGSVAFLKQFEHMESTCVACAKKHESKLKSRCSRCKVYRYCDRDCQLSHWKQHKDECVGKAFSSDATLRNVGIEVTFG